MLLCYLVFLMAVYQTSGGRIPEYIVEELYSKYEEAMANENFKLFTRRIFKGNKQFEIHVEKLREVNGYKKHNLIVKESLKSGADPYIYINNPVESRIPKAYLTLEEFKEALTNRILVQREEIRKKQPKIKQNLYTMKYIAQTFTRNESRLHSYNTPDKYTHSKATMETKVTENIGTTTKKSTDISTVINAFNERNILETDNTNSVVSNTYSEPPETESIKLVPINNTIIKTVSASTRNYSSTDITNATIEIDEISEENGISNATDSEIYTITNVTDEKTNETLSGETSTSVLSTIEIIQKETPRRKATVTELSVTTAPMKKKSRLGRPLVFLGN